MKQISSAVIALLLATTMFAQMPDKFVNAMQSKLALMDSARDVNALNDLAAAFERIADAEKTQWLPYYYAAVCHVNAGNMQMTSNGNIDMGNNSDKTDPAANKAEELLNKAEALTKENSEIFIVKKMIATLRLMGDPMNRYMTYGAEGAQALETAKKLNPENPRIYLLEGLDKFYTPEQFGGSKEDAKKLFEEALKKYESFKPESNIHPNWGKNIIDTLMLQMK
ncbi:MAG TPA: hypothetical protein VFP87_03070 [Chitinophagaceae bacterium]|nr:hypothetical protein [Chitinophagaceae bacterium]